MIAKTTKDFETVLAVADKNIAETRKTLEERIRELTEKNKVLTETVESQKKTIEETKTLSENTADRLKPQFKGKAQIATEKEGLPNLVKPY
jgi:tRNA uridine 5-carbamoylmethylation protein Kti12